MAALDLFGENSYEGVGIRAIATRAGVDQSLVSRYFGGKEGLLLAVVKEVRDGFGLAELLKATDRHEWGRVLARRVVHSAGEESRLAFAFRAGASESAREIVREQLNLPLHGLLRDSIGGDDAAARASAVVALMAGAATATLVHRLPETRGRAYESLLARSLQLIIDSEAT